MSFAYVAVTALAYTVYSGERAASAQKKANARAEQAGKLAADQQDQAMNKANAKTPDLQAILAGNLSAGGGGAGSTLLTGASGVDGSKLLLGKSTLLGGGQ